MDSSLESGANAFQGTALEDVYQTAHVLSWRGTSPSCIFTSLLQHGGPHGGHLSRVVPRVRPGHRVVEPEVRLLQPRSGPVVGNSDISAGNNLVLS